MHRGHVAVVIIVPSLPSVRSASSRLLRLSSVVLKRRRRQVGQNSKQCRMEQDPSADEKPQTTICQPDVPSDGACDQSRPAVGPIRKAPAREVKAIGAQFRVLAKSRTRRNSLENFYCLSSTDVCPHKTISPGECTSSWSNAGGDAGAPTPATVPLNSRITEHRERNCHGREVRNVRCE